MPISVKEEEGKFSIKKKNHIAFKFLVNADLQSISLPLC